MASEVVPQSLGAINIFAQLDRIEHSLAHAHQMLHTLTGKVDYIMAVVDDLKAGFATLDAETTAIAKNIDVLVGKIKNSMTDEEVAEVKGMFSTLGSRLVTLAVDPTTPVPPAPAPLMELRKKL